MHYFFMALLVSGTDYCIVFKVLVGSLMTSKTEEKIPSLGPTLFPPNQTIRVTHVTYFHPNTL